MIYKTTFIVLIMMVFFSSFVYGVALPSTVDAQDIIKSIDETSKYCYDQAVIRDDLTKVYIEEKLNDIYQDINRRMTLFKFINSIVTFIVVFLALYINRWLDFKRTLKIKEINTTKITSVKDKPKEKSQINAETSPILKEKIKKDNPIYKPTIEKSGFEFVFNEGLK